MKVYISGKIGNLPREVYYVNFERAEVELKSLFYLDINLESVNPCKIEGECGNWFEYMKRDLKAMLDCDAIYLLSNWMESPGARLEASIALQLGMKIIYQ